MVGLRDWWKMAVVSVGLLSTSGVIASEGYLPSKKPVSGRVTASQPLSRGARGNPFATVSDAGSGQRREAQRRLSPADRGLSEELVGPASEERSAQAGDTEAGAQTAGGEKTAFFGCGWGGGCYPCRPVCRPACPPVGYGCPSPYSAPVSYYGGYGAGCAPVGGCYPPPAPAPVGGFYSGPVLPPAISSPVIGSPAGYYGGGYPGYGAPSYGAQGYGAPVYGYPIYGDARSSNESQTPNQFDQELMGKTRAVSRLQQDHPRNPFAD